jgi:endonuclease/exonuclease/phosphatase (EEP) superfamily protein YafD
MTMVDGRRMRLAIVAALAVGALLATGCALHGVGRPTPEAILVPCERGDCLRVLTWNLHAIPFIAPRPEARLHNVAVKVREQQPDVVVLQEVWAHAYARLLERDLADEYRLTSATGCGRPFPCGGLAILVRTGSGWEASAPTFVAYGATAPWYRLFEWDGIAKKGMLTVRLVRGTESLTVLDTHLQTEYTRYGRDYTPIRRAQLEQLARAVANAPGDRPAIIAGDFNTSPGERSGLFESHLALLGDDRTTELRIACGECGTRPSLPRPARWLDHVFTRGFAATATAARIVNERIDQPFSDHDGVLVRLQYGAPLLATPPGRGIGGPPSGDQLQRSPVAPSVEARR